MSIEAFLASAKEKAESVDSTAKTLSDSKEIDLPMGDFFEKMDATANSQSITDEQFLALKKVIAGYRVEIEAKTFVPSTEKLHNIVMWFRVSREKAIVIIKEKIVKEKKPRVTKPKKAMVVIEDLM